MEIRTTIKGSHGEDIQILAENATEYTNAMNTLVRQQTPKISPKPIEVSTPAKVSFVSKSASAKEIKHVTPAQVKQMRTYKKEGMTTPDIADKMNLAYSTVWRRVHKMKPAKEVSLEEQMQITRIRHKANPPAYHRDCPCCDPTSTTSFEDWLRRSKQARTDRLLAHRKNQ